MKAKFKEIQKLDVVDLMTIKGGSGKAPICILTEAAVKCTVKGSGVIIEQPDEESIDKEGKD